MSCGAVVGSTSRAPETLRTSASPPKYDPSASQPPTRRAMTVTKIPPDHSPVAATPMLKPSAAKSATTISESRNDLRLFSAIWL